MSAFESWPTLQSGISFYFEACQAHSSEFEAGTKHLTPSPFKFDILLLINLCNNLLFGSLILNIRTAALVSQSSILVNIVRFEQSSRTDPHCPTKAFFQ